MKNRLMKIWGIVLVLVVLAALLVPALPASAAVLNATWSSQSAPATLPFNQLIANANSSGTWYWEVAPDGKTMFALNTAAPTVLYKSTNGGQTFSSTGFGAGLPTAGIVALVVSSDYANDSSVVVATGAAGTPANTVYRSINGGATFGALPATGLAGNITSVDVGANYLGGQAIVVGTATGAGGGGAARFTTSSLNWVNLGFSPVSFVDTVGQPVDVYGVALGPQAGIGEVIAVTQNATAMYLETKLGTNVSNADVSKATISTAIANSATTRVTFAFPADFDVYSNNKVFIGIGNTAGAAAGDDVYRVSGALGVSLSLVSRLNVLGQTNPIVDSNVYSVSFKGNLADGWLYVGVGNQVWRATTAGLGTVTFIPAAKAPTGSANAIVMASAVAADTSIFAMTSGAGSALSLSTDGGATFNQISLINISASGNVKFVDIAVIDLNNMYLLMQDSVPVANGTSTMLFKSANAGVNWQGIWSTNAAAAATMNRIYPSPAYATDNTLYVTQTDSRIWKSSNAGGTFTGYSSPNSVIINAFAPVDATTYYVGSANAIYKSGSYVAATINGETPFSIAYVSATDMFVGTAEGSVYESTNGGTSFAPVGTPRSIGGTNIIVLPDAAYATNKMIFAGASNGIYKFTVGTSASWAASKAGPVVNGMSMVADGTLYVSDGTTNAAQVWRCTTPTTPGPATWDAMGPAVAPVGTGPGYAGYPVAATTLSNSVEVAAVATGTAQVPNNTIFNLVNLSTGPFIYAVQDTCVAAPAVSAPAANAQVPTNATFTWSPVTTAVPVKYDFQIAYDVAFTNNLVNNTAMSGTIYVATPNTGFNPGTTYYWRTRVSSGNPVASKWSASTKFSVLLAQSGDSLVGAGGNQIYPAAGATNIPTKPVFQWAAIQGAASYDLQVADNPVFVNPLDSQTGLNTTVWTETKTLDNAKTYYWRVRAVSASGTASDWVAQAFTTVAAAPTSTPGATVAPPVSVVIPTITVNVPTQPAPTYTITVPAQTTSAPSTPASIWVLIAIGAILIIAVIVLIARTRRV